MHHKKAKWKLALSRHQRTRKSRALASENETETFPRERLRRVLRKKNGRCNTSADLHLHTFTSADLHLHTFTSADLPRTFTSADLLSLFFLISLLMRGRCRRSATKRNPFARNGHWTSKTAVKLRFWGVQRNHFVRNERWTSKSKVKLRFWGVQRNPLARNGRWRSKSKVKLRFWGVQRNPLARNGRWTSKTVKIAILRCQL